MRIPLFGILSALFAAFGLYGLFKYERLSPEEKESADRLACDFASRLCSRLSYRESVQQLRDRGA